MLLCNSWCSLEIKQQQFVSQRLSTCRTYQPILIVELKNYTYLLSEGYCRRKGSNCQRPVPVFTTMLHFHAHWKQKQSRCSNQSIRPVACFLFLLLRQSTDTRHLGAIDKTTHWTPPKQNKRRSPKQKQNKRRTLTAVTLAAERQTSDSRSRSSLDVFPRFRQLFFVFLRSRGLVCLDSSCLSNTTKQNWTVLCGRIRLYAKPVGRLPLGAVGQLFSSRRESTEGLLGREESKVRICSAFGLCWRECSRLHVGFRTIAESVRG